MVSDLEDIKRRLEKLHMEFLQIVIDLLEYEKSLENKNNLKPLKKSYRKYKTPLLSEVLRYPPTQTKSLNPKGELKR